MEIKLKLENTANLKKCDNKKLPAHLKDLTEGDHLVFKTQEEFKADGIDESNPIFFLSGRGFIATSHTINGIESDNEFISQIEINQRVKQILADNGYKGEDLKDGEFINVTLNHVKFAAEKKEEVKKEVISLREKASVEINEELYKEMISKVNRETLKKQFQIPMSVNRKPMNVPDAILDMYLEKWAKSKAPYYLAFGKELTLSKKIEYAMEENEMGSLISGLIRKYPQYALNIVRIHPKSFVDNKMPNIPEFKTYFGDDYSVGMKVSKFLSLFNDKDFDKEISVVMQERMVKGNLCLSIDPYDYMTHAITMHGWGSCHSPVSGCHPSSSFMYMIDENTIVAYKHNGKEYLYDKGVYNDAGASKTFDFKKNAFTGNSKSFRQLISVDQDTTSIMFGREYPKRTTSDDLRVQVRDMLEEALSNYLGIDNTWNNYGANLTKYKAEYNGLYYYSDTANYESLRKSYGDTVKLDFVTPKDSDVSKAKVHDGTKVYCLNCGKELKNSSVLCDSCYN